MADASRNDADRFSLLKMSESWMRMVRDDKNRAHQKASDAFDAEQVAKGTGQDDSESSH